MSPTWPASLVELGRVASALWSDQLWLNIESVVFVDFSRHGAECGGRRLVLFEKYHRRRSRTFRRPVIITAFRIRSVFKSQEDRTVFNKNPLCQKIVADTFDSWDICMLEVELLTDKEGRRRSKNCFILFFFCLNISSVL